MKSDLPNYGIALIRRSSSDNSPTAPSRPMRRIASRALSGTPIVCVSIRQSNVPSNGPTRALVDRGSPVVVEREHDHGPFAWFLAGADVAATDGKIEPQLRDLAAVDGEALQRVARRGRAPRC